ncbi:MAG: branched-chain amino acid ABC transporter permease [Alphaproteobacteria bacterium]|nr:branched-chain amino acid ABC transporter permease [Alphaproteobacteria bacterium]
MTALRRRAAIAAALLAFAVLLLAPAWLGADGLHLVSIWSVTTIAAIGLNLTVGFSRQVSLAQGAFVGIGAYLAAVLSAKGWPFATVIALAGLLCLAIALPLGHLCQRSHRHGLAMGTLGFAALVHLFLAGEPWPPDASSGIAGILGGGILDGAHSGGAGFHRLCVLVLALATLLVWRIMRSPWGRALQALRENPGRAETLGVCVPRYVLAMFAIGAFLGGVAGALYAPLMPQVDPSHLTFELSVRLLLIVVLGGGGYLLGPFLGAGLAVLCTSWLGLSDEGGDMVLAVAALATLALRPAGLVALAKRAQRPPPAEQAP